MEGLNPERLQSQENILNPEQQKIADLESVISFITLEEGGKINLSGQERALVVLNALTIVLLSLAFK